MTAQQPTARDEVADSHGPILKRYRREVQDVFGDLSVQGLPETRHNIGRLRLDQIYIRLNLELQAGSAERAEILNRFYDINWELTDFEAHAEQRKDEGEIGARIQAERQLVLRNKADILARTTTKSEPLDLAQAMIESRHLIVLGAPGSGKTTMTRWLALTFAQDLQAQPDRLGHAFKGSQLPVVVELGRLARWIKDPARWPGAEGLAPQLARFIADDPRFDGDIMAPIERVIEEGPCLLLFDGLDEVANPRLRRRIAESIQALARADQSSNLVLVTSRPSGFRDVDLGPTFRVGEVQPFTPEDVRRFVGQWYAMAYGQRYRHEAEALVREIEGKDRIAALAENPLLCSVIAVVHRRSGQLPNRRVDLYEECCKVLLETWDDARDVERPIVLEGLDWSSKLLLLGELAFWMHEHAEKAHVGRNEVVAQLRPPLAKLRQVSEAEAGIDAEDFVMAIEDQAGLIQGRGDSTIEFSHRTFQEYLAARHIAAQPNDVATDLFMRHLNEARWEEVHLLTLGRLGGSAKDAQQAASLIKTLLNVYPKPRPWLSRGDRFGRAARWILATWQYERQITWLLARELVLAVRGSADARPEGRNPSIRKRLESELAAFLGTSLHGRAVAKDLMSSRNPFVGELVLQPLVSALDSPSRSVRGAAAEALGPSAMSSHEARAALLNALRDPEYEVRCAAVQALGPVAASDHEARAILIKVLRDPDYEVRCAAAQALGLVAASDHDARATLIKALRDPDYEVRRAAAQALGSSAASDHKARTALIKALRDPDQEVRRASATALQPSAAADHKFRTALIKALGKPGKATRRAAAAALRLSALSDREVGAALHKALGDPDYEVRRTAATALGRSAASDREARAALLKALGDFDGGVRRAAGSVLGPLAVADDGVRAALLKTLNDPREWARCAAAEALGPSAASDHKVRAALLEVLGDSNQEVRRGAAVALVPSAATDHKARAALLEALRDPDFEVRRGATQGLGASTASDHGVRDALLKALRDPDEWVREAAATAIGPSAAFDPPVRAGLLKALGDPYYRVCCAAVLALGPSAASDPMARAALFKRLGDPWPGVRDAAATALWQIASKLERSDFSRVLKVLVRNFNRTNAPLALTAITAAVAGRPLPGYRWVPLAERAKRKRRWRQIRLRIYVVSFVLLAALGIAAITDHLPTGSIWLNAGGILVILVPTLVALNQLYNSVKSRSV